MAHLQKHPIHLLHVVVYPILQPRMADQATSSGV